MRPTHTAHLLYNNNGQVDAYVSFVKTAQELLSNEVAPISPRDVTRALVLVASRYCYESALVMGYDAMGPVFKKEMIKLFSDALDAADGDTDIIQIMPH